MCLFPRLFLSAWQALTRNVRSCGFDVALLNLVFTPLFHQVQLISELSGGRADTQRNRLFALFAALFLAVALAIAAAGFLGGREHAKCLFCGAAGDMFYASAFFLVLSAICALRYGFSPRTVIRFYRAGMARRVPAMETEFRASGYTDAVYGSSVIRSLDRLFYGCSTDQFSLSSGHPPHAV